MRPSGLKETTILMCIFNVCGYAAIDPSFGYLTFQLMFATLIISLSFIVIWFYFKGKNWARILVLLTSVVALINTCIIAEANLPQKVIIIGEAMFACFLLYWLNTKQVKMYFSNMPHGEK